MFQFNPEWAKEGSSLGGGLIDESGAFKGKIIEAKQFQGNEQSNGIELSFEREDGAKANFIKLYLTKKDGTEGYGIKQVHALMACMRIMTVNNLDELCRPVGLVLQREEYYKSSGEIGFSMKLVCPFDPVSQKTAKEIVENAPAGAVMKILETLKDKTVQKPQQQVEQNPFNQQPQPTAYEMDPFGQYG